MSSPHEGFDECDAVLFWAAVVDLERYSPARLAGLKVKTKCPVKRDRVQVAGYYSRCFSVGDRAAAQRGAWLRGLGYIVSPPFVRFGSGGHGLEAGAVVVPAGAGLVAAAPA